MEIKIPEYDYVQELECPICIKSLKQWLRRGGVEVNE